MTTCWCIEESLWSQHIIIYLLLLQIVEPRWGWRWLLVLSSVPCLVVLLFYKIAPESPRYLSAKGRWKEAQNVLEKAAELNRIKLPSGTLVSDDQMWNMDESLPPAEDTYLLSSSTKKTHEPKRISHTPSLLSLFSRKFIRTTLLLWFLYFRNTFSYYGIILLTSELSSGKNKCGPVSLHLERDASLYIDVFVTNLAGSNAYLT